MDNFIGLNVAVYFDLLIYYVHNIGVDGATFRCLSELSGKLR
jgi:hypothetical protein